MDEFLLERVRPIDRKEYQKAPEASLTTIRNHLAEEEQNITQNTSDRLVINQKIFEHHVNILNAAERLLSIFIPVSFEAPCVSKLWGAIYRIIQVSVLELPEAMIHTFR